MDYRVLFEEENEKVKERWELCLERIAGIRKESGLESAFQDYFQRTAEFIIEMAALYEKVSDRALDEVSLDELKKINQRLYEDVLPEAYGRSYANPAYAVKMLGNELGRILGFLYAEIRGMIVYAYEQRLSDMTICCELFIQIYNMFEEEIPTYREVQQVCYWFVSDYSDITVTYRVQEQLDPELSFAKDIIMESDLSDLRYLYAYGEYVSENEIKMAEHLNGLSDEQIQAMADTYTEGYRMGFVNAGIDLSKKKTVNIRYNLGFERIVRAAIRNFEKMGLSPVIYRAAVNSINKKQHHRIGYFGGIPNKQYDYDHKGDASLYLDNAFIKRKLDVLGCAYEEYKELASVHAGPAVIETFGEIPFVPETKEEAYRLGKKQQQLSVEYDNAAGQIVNQYIKGDERSFTIIAFPVPEIGAAFPEIFDEIVKVNTLDYKLYQSIQQTIIDTLDQGEYVCIKGMNGNRTNLRVHLHELQDSEKETIFENCVADVNIPVGEVFTSPVLKGTEGTLHVSQVYLNELKYKDLCIVFKDGMVQDFSCANFDTEEENKRFVKENVLYHHDTLPMGEFAVGTNTTAYVMAKKYGIADKLPILIAEKMGPHFAVGDTCYSWSEDNKIYNPDGKEIVAKDNEISILRKEDISKAYLGCHTDITIPYEELGILEAVKKNGETIPIIREGRFVLAGCEELNRALDEMQ